MKQITTPDNQKQVPKGQAPLTGAETRLRIYTMQLSGDYPILDQQYLAKKLNRSETAIVFALDGKSPKLLARINRHLDWLVAQREKKIQSLAA
jgi:hypothetical protein